ncbi:hypothetical protein ALC60_05214 [Trachymyrmex zeteki]|uniref:Uncharacterized protein n=1 Tax=Mycetomoellerius zeteki TaxID=64791 RepID=A0A151X6F8_9HYME|nr:hypothetical protein ALC60_05214 [Trachymyrmex zeteki]
MNIGKSVSRLDLGLQNSSAMAHQARGLPQLRIKFYNTIVAGLQIVLLLTVLPQGKLAETHFSIFYCENVRDITRVMIFFIVHINYLLILKTFNLLFLCCIIYFVRAHLLYAVIADKALHLDWDALTIILHVLDNAYRQATKYIFTVSREVRELDNTKP